MPPPSISSPSRPGHRGACRLNGTVRRRQAAVILALLLPGTPTPLPGQNPGAAPASCEGKVVSDIVITPLDPSFLSIPPALRALARGVGLHHTTSKPWVIGRFVLLDVGEPCTDRKLAETGRILRLQPFLADASVRAVADTLGGVRIEIETIDEIPTVFRMRIRGLRPSAIRFGNGNVGGQGLYLAGSVERGFAYRTGVGVEATAHQLAGRPYRLSVTAERAPLGSTLALALGHPFHTELQRMGWTAGYSDVNGYLSFVRQQGAPLSLGVERRFWNAGLVHRLGSGRNSGFVGALLTGEEVTPAEGFVVISDSGRVADTSSTAGAPVPPYRNIRFNAVVGIRALSFLTVRGFDALTAVQDVATGVQFGTLVGRGFSRSRTRDGDRILAVDLYAGHGSPRSFAGLRLEGEVRLDIEANRRDSMVGSGRLAWYLKPAEAHVLIASAEFGGGRRLRVPFQLRLGDLQGGVRGYADSRKAGAGRVVLRLEDRWSLGGLTRHGAFGLAGFVDAGWLRAGDAPFGVSTRIMTGLGIGFLAAFPPQSARLWRLDLAVPVSRDADAGWEVRLSSAWTRSFWREPDDVARGRAGAAPSTIFAWP
jgi:hypothetical protein